MLRWIEGNALLQALLFADAPVCNLCHEHSVSCCNALTDHRKFADESELSISSPTVMSFVQAHTIHALPEVPKHGSQLELSHCILQLSVYSIEYRHREV